MSDFKKGFDALEKGELDKAEKHFLAEIYNKFNKNSTKRAMAAYYIGIIYEWKSALYSQKARALYGKSGNLGNKDALYKLGTLYQESGNYDFAMWWYAKADQAGHHEAKGKIEEINKLRPDLNPYTACEGF